MHDSRMSGVTTAFRRDTGPSTAARRCRRRPLGDADYIGFPGWTWAAPSCALHCIDRLSALRSMRYTVGSRGHLFLFGLEIPSTFRQKLADLSPDPYGDDDLESQ